MSGAVPLPRPPSKQGRPRESDSLQQKRRLAQRTTPTESCNRHTRGQATSTCQELVPMPVPVAVSLVQDPDHATFSFHVLSAFHDCARGLAGHMYGGPNAERTVSRWYIGGSNHQLLRGFIKSGKKLCLHCDCHILGTLSQTGRRLGLLCSFLQPFFLLFSVSRFSTCVCVTVCYRCAVYCCIVLRVSLCCVY